MVDQRPQHRAAVIDRGQHRRREPRPVLDIDPRAPAISAWTMAGWPRTTASINGVKPAGSWASGEAPSTSSAWTAVRSPYSARRRRTSSWPRSRTATGATMESTPRAAWRGAWAARGGPWARPVLDAALAGLDRAMAVARRGTRAAGWRIGRSGRRGWRRLGALTRVGSHGCRPARPPRPKPARSVSVRRAPPAAADRAALGQRVAAPAQEGRPRPAMAGSRRRQSRLERIMREAGVTLDPPLWPTMTRLGEAAPPRNSVYQAPPSPGRSAHVGQARARRLHMRLIICGMPSDAAAIRSTASGVKGWAPDLTVRQR